MQSHEVEMTPRMVLQIPEPDKALLRGVIDMHLHAAPCLYDRPFDEIECARQALAAGYRALVLKSIYAGNADRVELVRKIVPGIELFGGMVLNHMVGGLNPAAVRSAIGFGAKVLWLPTVHAANHIRYFGVPTYPWLAPRLRGLLQDDVRPIRVIDDGGNLLPETREILDLASDAGLVVATGHVAADEIFAVLRYAQAISYRKIVCTHVGWHATDWPLDDLKRMAGMGAYLEFTINPCMPARQQADPREFARSILAVGPEHCITSTDLGQRDNAHPVEGYRMFLRILLNNGLSLDDIDRVARINPAYLLDLPPQDTPAEEADADTAAA